MTNKPVAFTLDDVRNSDTSIKVESQSRDELEMLTWKARVQQALGSFVNRCEWYQTPHGFGWFFFIEGIKDVRFDICHAYMNDTDIRNKHFPFYVTMSLMVDGQWKYQASITRTDGLTLTGTTAGNVEKILRAILSFVRSYYGNTIQEVAQ